MINELLIKGYKKIVELKLQGLSRFNIITGPNSSGKTSISEALQFVLELEADHPKYSELRMVKGQGNFANNFFDPSHRSLRDGFTLEISFTRTDADDETIIINERAEITERTSYTFGLKTKSGDINLLRDIYQGNYFRINVFGNTHIDSSSKTNVKKPPDTLTVFDLEDVQYIQRFFKLPVIDTFDDPAATLHHEDSKSITLASIAGGIRVLASLRKFLRQMPKGNNTVLFIEEPEMSLHPSWQKRFPILIDRIVKAYEAEDSQTIQVFIITHSPVIVASALDISKCKIFPLNAGKIMNLGIDTTDGTQGYRSKDAAITISSTMLGMEAEDIGYPQNFCIVEETSFQTFLDIMKESGVIKNIGFISSSGSNKALTLSKKMFEISQYSIILKTNPWYYDKFLIILDKLPSEEMEKINQDQFFKKLKDSGRLIWLKKDGLEAHYPEALLEQFKKKFEKVKGDYVEEGKLKVLFAEKFARHVLKQENRSSELKKRFGGSVNILLNEKESSIPD